MQQHRRVSEVLHSAVSRSVFPIRFELLERRLMWSATDGWLTLSSVSGETVTLVRAEDAGNGVTVTGEGELYRSIFDDIGGENPAPPPASDMERLDLGGVESAQGVAVQADGKVIVFGFKGFVEEYQHQSEQMPTHAVVARFNADGSLDTSFDDDGYTLVGLPRGYVSYGSDVVIGADGSIYAGTHAENGVILKFSADGDFVDTFNVSASQLALQADGKIVYLGTEGHVGRLNPDGSADATFGDNGIASLASFGRVSLEDIALDDDGNIVIAGYRFEQDTIAEHDKPASTGLVVRLTADGSIDSSFGDGGAFTLGIDGRRWEMFESLLVQPDGKIVIGGNLFKQWRVSGPAVNPDHPYRNKGGALMLRLNDDGSLDEGFGDDGVRWDQDDDLHFYDMKQTADGRIVSAVYAGGGISIAVIDETGEFEVLTKGGVGDFPIYTTNVALAPDGTVIAVGHVSIQDTGRREEAKAASDLMAVRFNSDGEEASQPPDSGEGGGVGQPVDGPSESLGTGFVFFNDGDRILFGGDSEDDESGEDDEEEEGEQLLA